MSKDVKANVNKKNKIIIIIAVVISLIILTFLGVNIYSISKGYDNIFNMVQEHKEGLKKSNSSEPKESTLLGDVNCDKVLNNKDLTMLQQYLAGDKKLSSQAQKNADLNNDNIIDDKDLKLFRINLITRLLLPIQKMTSLKIILQKKTIKIMIIHQIIIQIMGIIIVNQITMDNQIIVRQIIIKQYLNYVGM